MKNENDQVIFFSSQAIIVLMGLVVENIIKYGFTIVLGRSLGAGALGIFFIGIAVITFVTTISKFGIDAGAVRYVSMYNSKGEAGKGLGVFFHSVKVSFFISILVSSILVFFAGRISGMVSRDPETAGVIRSLSLTVPVSTFIFMAVAYFQANLKMKYQVYVISVIQPILNIIIFICLLFVMPRLWAAVWSYALSFLCAALAAIYFLKNILGIFNQRPDYNYERRGLMAQSTWVFLILILGFFIRGADTFILGHFRSAAEVGVYNVAMRGAAICGILSTTFISIFAPAVSRLHSQNNRVELSVLFKTINRWILSLTLPVFVLFMVYPSQILTIFGRDFNSGSSAFMILSASFLFVSLSDTVAYSLLAMTGNIKLSFYNNLAGAVTAIFLNIALIPRYGIVGAAAANLASFSLMGILTVSEVYLLFKMHPYHFDLLRPVLAGAAAYGILIVLKNYSNLFAWHSVLIHICLAMSVYTLIVGLHKKDRQVLRALKDNLVFNYGSVSGLFGFLR